MTEDKGASPETPSGSTHLSPAASDPSNPSDASRNDPATSEPGRRGPPPNPLYHPLFLPVLLVGFMLWFFWDGFMTSDPDMLKHQLFNRVCFGITLLLCLRVVPRGIREYREDREAAERDSAERAASE